ncbi:MAG: pentapeptide repeat-containing protein [bacterium]|nr:pentapeptide repeat-containing protein [bacterium]
MTKCNYCKEEHQLKNTGCYNSGNYNSGYSNSGSYNSGYSNSGNYNSGNYNSGNYNSGYYNSGWFNTDEPTMRFFNKESSIKYSDFNVQVYPDLKICDWVELNALPIDEQTESAKQMGGLLKTLTYKEAWAKYWNRASDSDKEWFQELPNFDEKIWEEITGIKLNAPLSLSGKEVSVTIDGKTYKAIIN